jgi:transposase
MIFSILETAKGNGIKPLEYVTHLLEVLPNVDVKDLSLLGSLMPWSDTLP